jgi:rRNA maturation RNase YbeY
MRKIEINNKAQSPIKRKELDDMICNAIDFLLSEGKLRADEEIELSFAFIDKEEIAALNAQYRKKTGPTDVLSFAYEKEGLNGEIVLCYDIIKENAHGDGISVEYELGKNIIHGILHILGYEHGEEMFRLQDEFSSGM